MCGIIGVVTDGRSDLEPMKKGLAMMRHRGPDGEGIWESPSYDVCLGHARLSILDLGDRGAQPMLGHAGCVITFNGEIYNYLEIRSELQGMGASFKTETDTEVLLAAYASWGESMLSKLNGMFSFAIYDPVRQCLFAARDRYGEKPFLFSVAGNRFCFASEYKALLSLPWISKEYDSTRLMLGLHDPGRGLDSDTQTVFKDIHQLLPSQALRVGITTRKLDVWTYWRPEPKQCDGNVKFDDAVAIFRETLVNSIRIRMRSDVPVGSCLSGGLDSGAIVTLLRKEIQPSGDYHTFTGTFPGSDADEWRYAQQVASESAVSSHTVSPSPTKFQDEVDDFVWMNELPVGSASQYAQYCVFRLAKEHNVTVLLDGQGADELLGGYEQYFVFYLKSVRPHLSLGRYSREVGAIRSRYPKALQSSWMRLRDLLPYWMRSGVARLMGSGSSMLYGISYDLARNIKNASERVPQVGRNPLASALQEDSFGRFLTTLLRYGDRNSMAHSREVRLPFCDHRLAELVLGLPPDYIMGEAQTKRLLREATRGVLPDMVRTRWNKQGFRPPQDDWIAGPLLPFANEVLGTRSFKESGIWDYKWWNSVLRRVSLGEKHLAWALWQPIMHELWIRHFVKAFGAKEEG